MEKLQNNIVLNFEPNTLQLVREEIGLSDPNVIKQSIEILEQWLKMQQHFVKKDFSQDFLERCLITNKGSVERTKTKIDKMCTVKNLMPQFFETLDAKQDLKPYKNAILQSLLPIMTTNQERVFILKCGNFEYNECMSYFRFLIKIAQFLKAYDYNSGVIAILDYTEANLSEILPKLNPVDIHQFLTLLLDSYSLRLKSLHLISESKLIGILVNLLKSTMSDKLKQRIFLHKNYDSLLEVVPKEVLPKEYGGMQESLVNLNELLMDTLSSEDFINHLKDFSIAITDETKRPVETFNNQYLGTAGSFRVINVD